MSRRPVATLVAVALLLLAAPAPPASAAAVTPCSKGNVALTFDDGPRSTTTGQVLDVLKGRRVPATFFVVGSNAGALPALIRREVAEGHAVANHTWGHDRLTSLSDSAIRTTLERTNKKVAALGAPKPKLVRPPYGATNDRVRSVIRGMKMTQVLWTLDPQDWRSGRSASTISSLVLKGLKPGANILLHDGVANSHQTVKSLPTIIDGARSRGYCFGVLDAAGKVVPATPNIRARDTQVVEGPAGTTVKAKVAVTLSVPTSRKVTVPFATADASAGPDDYKPTTGTLVFAPGQRKQHAVVKVRGDALHEPDETFTVRLGTPTGGRVTRGKAAVVILDDDPA